MDATHIGCSISEGGGALIKAHKLILSAYSEVFKDMFTKFNDTDRFVYMKGLSYNNLSSILDFMYQGSVDIPKSKVDAFLADAQELQIKGLKFDNENTRNNEAASQKEMVIGNPSSFKGASRKTNKHIKKEEDSPITTYKDEYDINASKDIDIPLQMENSLKRVKRPPKKRKLEVKEQFPVDYSTLPQSDLNSFTQSVTNTSQVDELNASIAAANKSKLDEVFENINDRWMGTGTKKRTISRCKLCSVEIRRDRRTKHMQSNHPNQDVTFP